MNKQTPRHAKRNTRRQQRDQKRMPDRGTSWEPAPYRVGDEHPNAPLPSKGY